jgi:DNA-binding MarR family transcriptional regulator
MIATKTEQKPRAGEGTEPPAGFELARFFPYRLSVLADLVSNAVSQVYTDRFDLTRADWRVVAALGVNRKMAAKDLGPYSALDKMQVSRAVQRLEDAGYIERHEDTDDRRSKVLQLTAAGRAVYQKIWPLVVAREEYILSALEPGERSALARVMEKVQRRTEELIQRG